MKTKKQSLILWGIAAAAVVAVIILMLIESADSKAYSIKNKTDIDISNIYVSLISDDLADEFLICNTSVPAKGKASGHYASPAVFSDENPGQIFVSADFDGKNRVVALDGCFVYEFSGKIKLSFVQENGEIYITMDSGAGLFKSANYSNLDDVKLLLDFENGSPVYTED